MIDFIGDVHGFADKLEELLVKLGYSKINGCYAHPERKAFFIGDLIDRGPKIRQTLNLVKRMVDNEKAIAIMGNHEYNALCFHSMEREGGHLRKHLIKNIIQHYKTLKQFQNKQEEYESYLEWFKTLPLFYETPDFRAVHACWDFREIDILKTKLINNKLNDDLIYQSAQHPSALNNAVEITLKGKEMSLPAGFSFTDKDKSIRSEIRIKWWEDPSKSNYHELSIEPMEKLKDVSIPGNLLKSSDFYTADDKPVFFGHYWLKGNPSLYRNNICCLDYSVAKKGVLACYRFDGEKILDQTKFVYV